MSLLCIAHPPGTGAREHWKCPTAAVIAAATITTTRCSSPFLPLEKFARMLTQHDLPRKGRIKHVRKAKSARHERPHAAQHPREWDGRGRGRERRTGRRGLRGLGRSECRGEGGERLWGDGQHGNAMSRRSWTGVRGQDGEDLGVRLEGDQDGLGGCDAATAIVLYFSGEQRSLVRESKNKSLPACQTVVQGYLGSLEFSCAAAVAGFVRGDALAYLVVGTTGVDPDLGL